MRFARTSMTWNRPSTRDLYLVVATTMSQEATKDEGKYDGPAGMEPDGVIDSNWDEVCENFDDMELREELLRGIYAYGFEKPSAIQQRAIVPCIRGMDVIAQAQSGTSKTATFSIAVLQKIDTGLRETQALMLAPTRELAQQIQKVVMSLGDYMGAQCHACIGGTSVREGARIRAWHSLNPVSIFSKMAMENVAVLPVPDWAWAITSIPLIQGTIARCWMALGFSKP